MRVFILAAHQHQAMVHYIRLLSPPQVAGAQKRLLHVSAVLAVTTDLGDAFFPEDVDLRVRIVKAQKHAQIVSEQSVSCNGASRALKVTITCPVKHSHASVRMHVAASGMETSALVPKILDVWSLPFDLADKQRADPLVDRELTLHDSTNLRIREETGDSIARHIWDASLGFLTYLAQINTKLSEQSKVRTLIDGSANKTLKVLELGAGCGIVGIAFAQMFSSNVLLTDLDDATEILATNIRLASLKSTSRLHAKVLDWSSKMHGSMNVKYDLVIVSDCIYNPDSSIHLVETLQRLANTSPQVLILVGFKRRHDADDVFFERMKAAKFEVLEATTIALPHTASDYDTTSPNIEFYTYQAPT